MDVTKPYEFIWFGAMDLGPGYTMAPGASRVSYINLEDDPAAGNRQENAMVSGARQTRDNFERRLFIYLSDSLEGVNSEFKIAMKWSENWSGGLIFGLTCTAGRAPSF